MLSYFGCIITDHIPLLPASEVLAGKGRIRRFDIRITVKESMDYYESCNCTQLFDQ